MLEKCQVLIQMEAQNSLPKTSIDPLFLQEKHPQSIHNEKAPPSQIWGKYLKDLYSDTVFGGMTPKKNGPDNNTNCHARHWGLWRF